MPVPMKEYREKRDFDVTDEPYGERVDKEDTDHRFVIHNHQSKRHHFDLRLEKNGVLASWAIPKACMPDDNKKVLAIQVEDHPIEYIDFEGSIPQGEYGAGEVVIEDKGKYDQLFWSNKKIEFKLHGSIYNSTYRLSHMEDTKWLFQMVD